MHVRRFPRRQTLGQGAPYFPHRTLTPARPRSLPIQRDLLSSVRGTSCFLLQSLWTSQKEISVVGFIRAAGDTSNPDEGPRMLRDRESACGQRLA
jgi:hypothetical protein